MHSLRTTDLNLCIDEKPNLKELQDFARHSDISTTMEYYARTKDDKVAKLQKSIWNRVFTKVNESPVEDPKD